MPTVSEIELRKIREQVHSGNYYIYPKLSSPISLTSGENPYQLGSYVEIIPTNTITITYFLMGGLVYNASSGIEYVIDVAVGEALSESVIGTLSFKYGITAGSSNVIETFQNDAFQPNAFYIASMQTSQILPSQEPLFPVAIYIQKNTRVSARLATSVGGYTCGLKLKYKI